MLMRNLISIIAVHVCRRLGILWCVRAYNNVRNKAQLVRKRFKSGSRNVNN